MCGECREAWRFSFRSRKPRLGLVKPTHHMSTRLYVGNLSFNSTESDLRDLFSQFGTVEDAALVTDRMTGNSRGFAFVTMSGTDEANAAAAALNGKEFQGRSLTVNEARPREEGGGSKFGPPRKKFGGGGDRGDRGDRGYRGGGDRGDRRY